MNIIIYTLVFAIFIWVIAYQVYLVRKKSKSVKIIWKIFLTLMAVNTLAGLVFSRSCGIPSYPGELNGMIIDCDSSHIWTFGIPPYLGVIQPIDPHAHLTSTFVAPFFLANLFLVLTLSTLIGWFVERRKNRKYNV